MKFKMKLRKDIFLKKSTWLVLALFAITIFSIPRFTAKAGNISATGIPGDGEIFRVLEIAPGNQFVLADTSVNPVATSNGLKVKVTQMSMAEYISMVDDIEGEYDAVVISNKVSADMPSSYSLSQPFRQYTAQFKDPMKVSKNEWNSENDITNKRAQNIVNMINKGQYVYIDSSIRNTNDTKLQTTKLFTIFNEQGIASKIKKFPSELTLETLANDFIENKNIESKRPKVKNVTEPADETKNTDGTVTPNRDLLFTANADVGSNEKVMVKLYLDFNADGIFEPKEQVNSQEEDGIVGDKDYAIGCQLYNSFVGYLDWKVEIVRPGADGKYSGVKASVTSNIVFKSLNGVKKTIKVLQVYPNTDTAQYWTSGPNTSYTRLTQNTKFMNLLKHNDALDDYDIQLEDISADEFQKEYGKSENMKHLKDNRKIDSKLTGDGGYDMVIIGFSDNYSDANKYQVDFTNNDTLEDLSDFIKANKSVMFTHDTMANNANTNKNLTKHFRDIIGQSRYVDPDRTDKSESNLYSSTDAQGISLGNTTIPHEKNLPAGVISSKGQTPFNYDGGGGDNSHGGNWGNTQTNYVRSVNKAQITQYPYDLSNLPNSVTDSGTQRTQGVVSVSKTHTQWYQLNLEDPDVVPWYNLVADSKKGTFNSGDSRNYYYSYSKGNITYSGTGHSGVGDEDQEFKLFINTMIKAERGANHDPIVENKTVDGTTIADKATVPAKIDQSKDYKFITIPADPDNDKLDVKVTATVKGATVDPTLPPIFDQKKQESGKAIDVTIPQSVYANIATGGEVEVTVIATDPFKKFDKKTFTIGVNKAPTIVNQTDKPTVNQTDKTTGDIPNNENKVTSKEQDYTFYTIPSDPDKDVLSLSVKVGESEISDSNLKIWNDNLSEFEAIDKAKVNSDSIIKVVIPKEKFANLKSGEKVKVTTGATDPQNESATKSFTITIQDPEIEHGIWKVDSTTGVGRISTDSIDETLIQANETPQFVGRITKVYDTGAKVNLILDKKLQLAGDKKVMLYRVINGNETPGEEMTEESGTGYYIYDLSKHSCSPVETEGMTFIVRYSAGLKALPSGVQTTPENYTNYITIDGKDKPVTINYKKMTVPDFDLF